MTLSKFAAPYRSARVLVTGGCGFIGAHLVLALNNAGADVYITSRHERPQSSADPIRTVVCDLTSVPATQAVFERIRPDFVFHLASHVTGSRARTAVAETLQANLVAAVNVMTAAAETETAKAIVMAGSQEVPFVFDADDEATAPCSPYAAAKLGASAYAALFRRNFGLPVTTARLFMVYGPAQLDRSKLIPYVITALLKGQSPQVSSGARPVDFVYVDDAVTGLLALGVSARQATGGADIGTGRLTTVADVVKRLGDLVAPLAPIAFGAVAERPNEQVRVADIARTQALIGWTPTTGLDEGLARTVAWYRAQA